MGDINNPFMANDRNIAGDTNYIRLMEAGGVVTEFGGQRNYFDLNSVQEETMRALFLNEEPFQHVLDVNELVKHIPAPILVDMVAMVAEDGSKAGLAKFCKIEEDFRDSGFDYMAGYRLKHDIGMSRAAKRADAYKDAEEAGDVEKAAKYEEYKPVECPGLDDFKEEGARISEPCVNYKGLVKEMEHIESRISSDQQEGIKYGEENIGNPIDPIAVQQIKM